MADEDNSGWQLTESDPGVFSELLSTLKVPLIVDDLYSLDSESLAFLQPIHALIFLFKWIPISESTPTAGSPQPDFQGFFAHQVVNNACATVAVINALGNLPSILSQTSLAEPTNLQNLISFAQQLDPTSRGLALTSSDWLREAHNSLSPPSAVSLDGLGLPKGEKEDAYHFVVYLPVDGAVYELDGLKEFAINHGRYDPSGEGWLAKARTVIEQRIGTYPAGALEFSLLALRDDPLPTLRARLAELQATNSDQSEIAELIVKISTETTKRERWAFENALRRHNHLGLVHALTLALAQSGRLDASIESARKKLQDRINSRGGLKEAMDYD